MPQSIFDWAFLTSASCACAENDNFIVQSVTASITYSCMSLFYALIWYFFDESFLSVTDIITSFDAW